MKKYFCVLFSLLCVLHDARALRNLSLSLPAGVLRSARAVTARCDYDLEGSELYSIRWYRDSEEFYRYVPRELPPRKVFPAPLPGATIDLAGSDERAVRVQGLARALSGVFSCEVSADAPTFHTALRQARLIVVEPPALPLQLSVREVQRDARGVRYRAECRAPPAFPPPNITWLVGDTVVGETTAPPPADGDFSPAAASSTLDLRVAETPPYDADWDEPDPEPESDASMVRNRVQLPAGAQTSLWCVARILSVWNATSRAEPLALPAPAPLESAAKDRGSAWRLAAAAAAVWCALSL